MINCCQGHWQLKNEEISQVKPTDQSAPTEAHQMKRETEACSSPNRAHQLKPTVQLQENVALTFRVLELIRQAHRPKPAS